MRITPPSDPTIAMLGLDAKTIACWSGCMPSGGFCASFVMSVNETPASVERITARPFERPLPPNTGSSS